MQPSVSWIGAVVAGISVATDVNVVGAQAPPRALPLANLGLEHLDIIVPDPAASAPPSTPVSGQGQLQLQRRGAE